MIRFKSRYKLNSRGFTLAEVVIALAIVGIMATSIFSLASNLMSGSYRAHNIFERTILMKNLFWQAKMDAAQKDFEKDVPDLAFKLIYKLKRPTTEKLQKFKNLFIATSHSQWQEFNREKSDFMATLITKEQKKAEQK